MELRFSHTLSRLNHTILLFFVPILGILIPLFTGLLEDLPVSILSLGYGYLFCILLNFLIWKGNMWILLKTRSITNQPLSSRFTLMGGFAINILYTLVLSYIMLMMLDRFFFDRMLSIEKIRLSVLVMVVMSVLANNICEMFLLRVEKQITEEKLQKTELEKKHATYMALKFQVDPHFLFNSLNTLLCLSKKESAHTPEFIQSLAALYQYVLDKRNTDKVMLQEELAFVKKYILVQKMRFGDQLFLDIDLSENDLQSCQVIPMSLQILVENAIKHNEISINQPLHIKITHEDGCLVVVNNLNKLSHTPTSTGIGLYNLQERCQALYGRAPVIHKNESQFIIHLPV